MAENEKKLIGTLQLNSGNVISTIEKVNKAQQNLGKGVDLNITKAVEGKVAQTLNGQQKQIETTQSKSKNAAKQTSNEIQKVSQLLKEQINLHAKLEGTEGAASQNEIIRQINKKARALQEYTPEILAQARALKTVTDAQDKYNLAVAKNADKRAAAEAKRIMQEQAAEQKRQAQEQAAMQKQAAQAALESAKQKERMHQEELRQQEEQLRMQEQYANRMGQVVVQKIGTATLSLLKDQWSAAIDYATSYYDTLNEIRVVTMKTEDEAQRIGSNFRQLAKDMKVTSTELSQAAVTFYRQGLSDNQVNDRQNWVTKYAKVANIEFNTAAELITAATNSMSEDIQGNIERIVDVFLYLGDAAATSGEEIGKAMQKASASATEFGLSFEWLGTYIATVAEQTRQAPESIGNAFNSMLARLHNIKQKGFNEEDETKINDVAKAQATVDITLMDSEGNWRDMSDIFEDISKKWVDMNGKQKSYIATTLAGTRQQNVFFALMNDMSKGIENGSRAWELYTGAMQSAGTATEKFSIWQESISAAQANLKNSLESLYASLQPGQIKDFYTGLAGFVDLLAQGTESMNGWNIVIGVVVGGLAALAIAFHNAGGAALFFDGILKGLASHPILAGIMALTVAISAITTAVGSIETSAEKYEKAIQGIDRANAAIESLQTTQRNNIRTFADLATQTELTTSEQDKLQTAMSNISEMSLTAKQAIEQFKDGQITATEATKKLNESLEQEIKNQKELVSYNAREALRNMDKSSLRVDSVSVGRTTWDDSMDNLEKMFHMQDRFLSEGQLPTWSNWMDHQLNGDFVELYDEMDQQFMQFVKKVRENLEGAVNPDDVGKEIEGAIRTYEDNLLKFKEQVSERLNTAFENMILASGVELSPTAKGILQQQMEDALLGGADDGEYNSYEWNKALEWFEKKRAELISKVMESSGDSDAALVGGESQLRTLASKIIGEDGIAEMETLIANYANDSDFVDAVNQAYTQMIEAGLSSVDIRKIFENIAFEDWGDVTLSKILADKMGITDFSEMFSWEDATGEIENLSSSVMGLMYSLLESGVGIDQITDALTDTNSLKEFEDNQKKIQDSFTQLEEDGKEAGQQTAQSFDDMIKSISTSFSSIEKIDSMLNTLGDKKNVSISDILGLAKTHPDILTALKDLGTLQKKQEEIRDLEKEQAKTNVREFVLNDENTFMSNQKSLAGPYWEARQSWLENNQIKTFQDLKKYYESQENADPQNAKSVDASVDLLVNSVIKYYDNIGKATESTEKLKIGWQQLADEAKRAGIEISDSELFDSFLRDRFQYMSQDDIGTYMKKQFGLGNVDLLNRPKYLDDEGNYETVASEQWDAAQDGKNYYLHVTPILPDGTKLDEDAMREYIDRITASGDILEADKIENGGQGLVLWMQEIGESIEDADEKAKLFDETLHVLQEMYYGADSLDGFAKKAAEEIEAAMAATNNYQEQLGNLMTGIEADGIGGALGEWDLIDPKIQEAISKQFPQLVVALQKAKKAEEEFGKGSEQASAATKSLAAAINNAIGLNTTKYFTGTTKAMDGVTKGTTRIVDGYATMNKEIEKAIKAQIEYETVSQEMAAGNEVNASSVSNLASLLGNLDPQWVLDNWSQIGPMLSDALREGENAIRSFNEAALITIMGNADVDFSDLENGLITVNEEAEIALQTLLATGQFSIEQLPVDSLAWVFENGQWIQKKLRGIYGVLKPTNNNPLSTRGSTYKPKTSTSNSSKTSTPRRSSGGGGSGGGSSGSGGSSNSSNEVSEVERMLDIMEQVQSLYANTRNIFQAQQNYYQQTGELQGVILYLQKEGEAILGQNKVLEENVAEIEKWMKIKKQELDSMSTSSEEYEQAASDLKALQDRHQEYTKQQIDNKTQIDKLNKAIKEQNDAIRSMEIDLRNTILEAIKDREALNERMLEGTITTENTIMDLIQKRYEKERDMILDNAEKQIGAQQEERDLLSEQLQLRKEQQEAEDQAAKLAELETKYARIVADPTRKNEALDIQQQIKNLREEMAWDTAERELKARQDELDNQISSIEDYVEYVKTWYDELFEHPQQLIAEMRAIIVQVDDDIITWLKENSEEFANATEATQRSMVNSWQEMIMDMHGEIKTYWDEVEAIIAGGDEAIIKFLMENSADYKQAGKLQAEQYVSEWVDKLNKLALAHKQVAESMIYNNYAVIASASGGSVSRSSGGSSGGGGSISTAGTVTQPSSTGNSRNISSSTASANPKYYSMSYMGKTGTGASKGSAYDSLINKAGASAEQMGYDYFASRAVPHYKNGGKVDFTGLAWMDGTKTQHEDVLNPYQSELFESLVRSIETIAKVKTPTQPMIGNDWVNGRGNAVSVGDIILNVDKLESDDDYEEVADKVLDMIMERVNRGSAIGGIRF